MGKHIKHENCQQCGESLSSSKSKLKFCDQICAQRYRYERYVERWLAGKESGMAGENLSSHVRRWLYETRGECCEGCGWAQENLTTGKIPLTVDHVDGNYRNNVPANLKVLCPNCHSLTPTYGGANRGKGRALRRKRRGKTQKFKNKAVYDAVRRETGIKHSIVRCLNCREDFVLKTSRAQKYCSQDCANKTRNDSVQKPTKQDLAAAVWKEPTRQLAKRYGVSDVAVSKWCKKWNIEKPPRGYW